LHEFINSTNKFQDWWKNDLPSLLQGEIKTQHKARNIGGRKNGNKNK